MASNTNFSLVSLDPDVQKAAHIAWLQTQSVFRDYNYVGSNINAELDVLARNTFLNAFFLNMTFSEGFNDSAQLRDSIVSKSKELNYLPYSASSPSALLNITLQSNIALVEMPTGTIFSGLNSNGSFYFVTDQNYFATSSNGTFNFSNVAVYEGFYTSDIFSVDNSVTNQLFTLSNPGIDTSSLMITVAQDQGSNTTIFTQAPNLYGLTGNSLVYFIQPSAGNTYQIYFGDGILGYLPQSGAVVTASYRVTNGDQGNFVNTFNLTTNLSPYNGGATIASFGVTAVSQSAGGAQNEDIESIRKNNPRHFQTQGNAITGPDFKTQALETFSYLKDVNVYAGGITPTAVQWGMIFIAAVTKSGNPTTLSQKNDIVTYFRSKNILNMPITVVDPQDLLIQVTTTVHVDFTQTMLDPAQYKSMVSNNLLIFSNNNLEAFDTPFRYSQMTDMIDNLDPSIISNETSVLIAKLANTVLNSNNSILINFNNPITSVNTTPFVMGGVTYNISDNAGALFINQDSANNSITSKQVGTVNYANGVVAVPVLNISDWPDNSSGLTFVATPLTKDVYALNNDIITIDPVSIVISIANN